MNITNRTRKSFTVRVYKRKSLAIVTVHKNGRQKSIGPILSSLKDFNRIEIIYDPPLSMSL
jgi:hypothetical protein